MKQFEEDEESELVGESVRIRRRGKRYYANYQLDDKQVRASLKTTSKKEARRLAIQIAAKLADGQVSKPAKTPSIQSVIEAYQSHKKTERRKPKTLAKIDLVCRRVLALAAKRHQSKLTNIDLSFVDAYRAERVAAPAKAKTVHNETVIIRQLINFALRRNLVTKDPLAGLELKKPKPTRQPCWTHEQTQKILAGASPPHQAVLVLLAETGMRVGEAKWLQWADVDFARGMIHIRPKEGWEPKTGDQRTVPMSERVRSLLEALPRRDEWVFTARQSREAPAVVRQISERRLLQHLKRVLKRLGLAGHVHTFRHAFISHALTQGTPEAIVRDWVGHVDRDVIKRYTHVGDQASQAAMQRLMPAANSKLRDGKEAKHGRKQQGAN